MLIPHFDLRLELSQFRNHRLDPQSDMSDLFQTSLVHSHWSRSSITALSLVERFIVLLAPEILCHKEPAPASEAPRGGFGIACPSLVPYGMWTSLLQTIQIYKY